MKRYDPETGDRLTDCCGAYSKYLEDGSCNVALCCRNCYNEVGIGEGDGVEQRPKHKCETCGCSRCICMLDRQST